MRAIFRIAMRNPWSGDLGMRSIGPDARGINAGSALNPPGGAALLDLPSKGEA